MGRIELKERGLEVIKNKLGNYILQGSKHIIFTGRVKITFNVVACFKRKLYLKTS